MEEHWYNYLGILFLIVGIVLFIGFPGAIQTVIEAREKDEEAEMNGEIGMAETKGWKITGAILLLMITLVLGGLYLVNS